MNAKLDKAREEKIKKFIEEIYNAKFKKFIMVNGGEFYHAVLEISDTEKVLEVYFEDNSDKIKSLRFVEVDTDGEDSLIKRMNDAYIEYLAERQEE